MIAVLMILLSALCETPGGAGLTAKLGSAPLTLEYSFDPKAYNRGSERPVLRLATSSLRETWLTIPVIVE